jgi:hypothetical protein
MPVIAGIDPAKARDLGHPIPDSTRDIMIQQFGRLPFYEASEQTIGRALRDMLDPGLRAEYAEIGRNHAQKWHDGQMTVRRLQKVYEKA